MSTKVTMSKRDFVTEHQHLAKVLTKGTPAQRQAEAAKQKRELAVKRTR
jgi:hypothetical protein